MKGKLVGEKSIWPRFDALQLTVKIPEALAWKLTRHFPDRLSAPFERRLRGSVYKNVNSLHFSLRLRFKRRVSYGVPARSTCDLRGSLRVCLSSETQEVFNDQGCARTGEPILGFWYVPRGSTCLFSPPVNHITERKTLQGHQWYLLTEEAGGAEKRFLETYGNVVRWNGPFGVRLTFCWTNTGTLCSNFLLKRLVCVCRWIVCGSWTPRPLTTSSKNPVIFMRSRRTFENGQRC